jgi:hypothetical protein
MKAGDRDPPESFTEGIKLRIGRLSGKVKGASGFSVKTKKPTKPLGFTW